MILRVDVGMWWLLLSLVWWRGTAAVPAPGPRMPFTSTTTQPDAWTCPEITQQPLVECSCDMPHTLRCSGTRGAMQIIGKRLRSIGSDPTVSLLDCTIQNMTALPGPLLQGVALHGLVISSGEIKEVHYTAFQDLAAPLQALGLPNNKLTSVPTLALKSLPELDRLDLSSNKMKFVDAESFKGLQNLSFIELSDNVITKIASNAFDDLPQLRILRLRGNQLTVYAIAALDPLPTIEELELSGNALLGPLGPRTFPRMESLRDLQLGHNTLSSIKKDALMGLTNLTTLSLHHNQIDVLEDNAFRQLGGLVHLDLAHNRIVAVSGASLAHLVNLIELDLRHNFLRALTADLILPLKSLEDLRLDDNDISIVASDALKNSTILKRLTLGDNPLNCDCSLIEFATWLSSSALSSEDKGSPVCATPPSLENGLLANVSVKDLVCGEDDEFIGAIEAPIEARINLETFNYDGTNVALVWSVDDTAVPYTCDAIFVYEEEGQAEVLLESNPLKCNSSQVTNPKSLKVNVPNSMRLRVGHRYRYCIVLLQAKQTADDMSLVLGCSDVLPLVQNGRVLPRTDVSSANSKLPRVISIQANLSYNGHLGIQLSIYPQPQSHCEINIAVLEQGALLSQRRVNCSEPKYTYAGLNEGSYRVCANIILPNPTLDPALKPRCITVFKHMKARRFSTLDVAFVSIFLILSFMVIALIWGVRRVLLRPKLTTHQCFLPPELDDEQQHNRYVKLQATTKL